MLFKNIDEFISYLHDCSVELLLIIIENNKDIKYLESEILVNDYYIFNIYFFKCYDKYWGYIKYLDCKIYEFEGNLDEFKVEFNKIKRELIKYLY